MQDHVDVFDLITFPQFQVNDLAATKQGPSRIFQIIGSCTIRCLGASGRKAELQSSLTLPFLQLQDGAGGGRKLGCAGRLRV